MATPYISYGLVSPHLENPADFPKLVLYLERSVLKHATAHIPKRCIQAEKNRKESTVTRPTIITI